jgi:hypothetical protein
MVNEMKGVNIKPEFHTLIDDAKNAINYAQLAQATRNVTILNDAKAKAGVKVWGTAPTRRIGARKKPN